jgi:hypothetical protein
MNYKGKLYNNVADYYGGRSSVTMVDSSARI